MKILKSNCRKELDRIKASKLLGSGRDEVYKPTSSVPYAPKFLHNIECPATLMEDEESQVPKRVIYHFVFNTPNVISPIYRLHLT